MTTHGADTLLAGRYRLGGLLGRGGMAEVYDAFDERLHRRVAVKVLRPEMAAQPGVRTRFEAEARSAARLAHPNVVAIYDTGEDGDTPFIVMERLPGETLADRMAPGPLDPAWLLRVAGDVLPALGAAHGAGIVHRDVKPGNILLAADGCAKVADFGIAKSLEVAGAADLTGTNQLVGTPAYLAPERLNGHPATPQADLYAMGVVLYEALAGTKPFSGPTPVAMAYAITHEPPRPLAEVRPDVPAALAAAIDRALAKDPRDRFSSAAEMAAALRGPGGSVATAVAAGEPTVVGSGPDSTQVLGVQAGSRAGALAAASGGIRRMRSLLPAGFLDDRRRVVLAAVAGLALVLLLIALAAGAGPGNGDPRARVAEDLREVAAELDTADGAASAEAERRLLTLADAVEQGGGVAEANAFLTQLAVWRDANQLTAAAVERMRTVVSRVPGVDPAAFSPPTTAPPVTEPPPVADEERKDDGEDKGKGRKGKGDDD